MVVRDSLEFCSVVLNFDVVEPVDSNNDVGKVEFCGSDASSHLNEQGQILGIGYAACTSLSFSKHEKIRLVQFWE